MQRSPTVMVSSTFYDLRQVRSNLKGFIENELGWHALLSEFPTFPVDPDASTIENCRERVDRDADILILIVGGRYGSIDATSAKSVTNIEYLAARNKGIPIYVFLSRGIIPLLPIWLVNPDADFSSAVDNPKLFEFVNQIRSLDKIWTHEFDYAEEIVSTLRTQLAFMVGEWMRNSMLLRKNRNHDLQGLSPNAIRLVLEQPDAWEYRLFLTVLSDEVALRRHLFQEYDLGISPVAMTIDLRDAELFRWIEMQIEELKRLSNTAIEILNTHLERALGPTGTPGDADALIFLARQLGKVYERALEWAQRVRSVYTTDEFRTLLTEMSKFTKGMILRISGFGPYGLSQIEEALAAPKTGRRKEVTLTLTLDAPDMEKYFDELAAIQRRYAL